MFGEQTYAQLRKGCIVVILDAHIGLHGIAPNTEVYWHRFIWGNMDGSWCGLCAVSRSRATCGGLPILSRQLQFTEHAGDLYACWIHNWNLFVVKRKGSKGTQMYDLHNIMYVIYYSRVLGSFRSVCWGGGGGSEQERGGWREGGWERRKEGEKLFFNALSAIVELTSGQVRNGGGEGRRRVRKGGGREKLGGKGMREVEGGLEGNPEIRVWGWEKCVWGEGVGEEREGVKGWERRGRKCWEVGGSEKGEGGIQKGNGGGGGGGEGGVQLMS